MKRWTEEEITRLRQIMCNFTKATEGCKYAAQELKRSYAGVYSKWESIKPKKDTLSVEETQKLLAKNVSNNIGNIREALRKTAEQSNKSFNTINTGYYNKTSPYYKDKTACFIMASNKKMAMNSKNFNTTKVATKTTKQKLKLWIARILGITQESLNIK